MIMNAMAGTPLIKMENGNLQANGEPMIKPDPDRNGTSLGAQFEDDIYEDAGDLDFADSSQLLYLTRLPKYLWKTWSQLEDDQEIHIGTIRVEGEIDNPKRVCRVARVWLQT